MKKFDTKSILYGLGGFMVGAMIMTPVITSAAPEDSGIKGAIGDIKAQVLGYDSAEELRDAASDKESRAEIAEAAGYSSREELHDAVAEAVDGSDELTDEQKQEFAERSAEREENREAFQAAVSEFLGISVDELEAAHEDGTKMDELLEDAGKSKEDLREYLEEQGIDGPRHGRGGHHHKQ